MEKILIVTIRAKGGGAEKIIEKLVSLDNEKFIWVNMEEFLHEPFFKRYTKFINQIFKNIIFCNKVIIGTEGMIGLIVAPFKFFFRRKYILWNHCYFHDYKLFLSRFNKFIYNFVYFLYPKRINASPVENKGIFVPNPYILENFEVQNRFINCFKIELISISSLAKLKNIDLTIKLVKYLSSKFVLKIYGEGAEKINLIALSKSLNLQDKIEFLGFIEKPFDKQVNKATVLIINSTTEALPTIVLESIERGIPVIVRYYKGSEYWKNIKSVFVVEKIDAETVELFVNNFSKLSNSEYCKIFEDDITFLKEKHSYENFMNLVEKL